MNKSVAQMVPGEVFVDDDGIVYAVISSKYSIDHTTARPCLRLTHNDRLHIEELPLNKVGRCIDRHELNVRIREYQRSVLEHDRQARADGEKLGWDATEERCWLWLQRFRRAVSDKDPTVMFALNVDDLRALETVLGEFTRLKNNIAAVHAKLDVAGVAPGSSAHRVECLIAERTQANEAMDTLKNMRLEEIHDALNRAMVPQIYNGKKAELLFRVEMLVGDFLKAKEANEAAEGPLAKYINDALDKAEVPHGLFGCDVSTVDRVEWLIAQRDQANEAKVVVDGPRAKYINEALDKAGVPTTFNGNDAILFDRVERLINKRNRLNMELATTTAELETRRKKILNSEAAQALLGLVNQYEKSPMVTTYGTKNMVVTKDHINAIYALISDATKDAGERQTLHNMLTSADVPTSLETLPERVMWLIARVGSAAINAPTKAVESSAFSEGLARINKAIEQLKPVFDAVDNVVALREAMDQCLQTNAPKTTTDSHARIEAEYSKVRVAGRKMLRKAWELIQAARVTVGNRDVLRAEPRYEPTSLLDVYQFIQQQHELADRELCSIDENDESKAERATYLRGLATAYVHVMVLIAALGTRGFELVQYKPNE